MPHFSSGSSGPVASGVLLGRLGPPPAHYRGSSHRSKIQSSHEFDPSLTLSIQEPYLTLSRRPAAKDFDCWSASNPGWPFLNRNPNGIPCQSVAEAYLTTRLQTTRTVVVTAEDIAEVAAGAIAVLNKVGSKLEKHQAPSATLKEHSHKLSRTRKLLQQVSNQEDLHTPLVASALGRVWEVLQQLKPALKTAGYSTEELSLLDELDQAAKNLRSRLPGDVFEANKNRVSKGFQANAPMGLDPSKAGRITASASENTASDAAQFNSAVYGNAAGIIDMAGKWWGKRSGN